MQKPVLVLSVLVVASFITIIGLGVSLQNALADADTQRARVHDLTTKNLDIDEDLKATSKNVSSFKIAEMPLEVYVLLFLSSRLNN